jgi:hypothetical protein
MEVGKRALLIKRSGKAKRLPTADTVSAFFVFKPTESKSPDHARSKNARVTKIRRSPGTPVTMVRPSNSATPIIIPDWIIMTSKSHIKRPSKIAALFAGVRSIFCRKPEFISLTMDIPDRNEPVTAFNIRIPGVR